jgi:hypothetical protein
MTRASPLRAVEFGTIVRCAICWRELVEPAVWVTRRRTGVGVIVFNNCRYRKLEISLQNAEVAGAGGALVLNPSMPFGSSTSSDGL